MRILGLPTPHSFFSSLSAALGTAATIAKVVDTFGTSVTIGELIRAGYITEKLAVAGSVLASFYVGAIIGCASTAAGAVLANNDITCQSCAD